MQRRGFTLIELLVVIAVIAVLMGILMPALTRARKQAWGVLCRSNLKQIGLAAEFYAETYDRFVPRGLYAAGQGIAPWFELFMPFLNEKAQDGDYRNVKMYRCPAYPDKQQTVCYVINAFKSKYSKPGEPGIADNQPTKLTRLRQRARTIYLADNSYYTTPTRAIITKDKDPGLQTCDVRIFEDLPLKRDGTLNPVRRVSAARHRRGGNMLYFDWHIETLDAQKMTFDKVADMWELY